MSKRTSTFALMAFMIAYSAGTAMAADLAPPPPPPPAPEIRPVASDWTGPYLGAVLGGTCMDTDWDLLQDQPVKDGIIDTTTPDLPMNGCGWSGGIMAGFNYQVDNVLFGVEGDFVWGGTTGEYADPVNATTVQRDEYSIDWMASLRARLGVLSTPKTLLYVTGGVGWMRGELATTQPLSIAFKRTHVGYVLGGGVEHALTENLHLRAEYLYSSYNTKTYGRFQDPDPAQPDADARMKMDHFHTFRVGVSWNFPISSW